MDSASLIALSICKSLVEGEAVSAEGDEDSVAEIVAASEDDFNMEGYVKALKEKMVIQNEQIRALSAYLDVSRKMLVQDEKIVNILEGMSRR